ncbi:MAG: DNA polymerase III subunit alpha, partial [Ruminococcus sp.]|nr:DNA polymerase III subunit alpha [Ruminococcus sp.]
GQMSFFDMTSVNTEVAIEIPPMQEFELMELLYMEKEMAGMYLSGHPIDSYIDFAQVIIADSIKDILSGDYPQRYKDSSTVRLVCIVTKNKTQITKSNQMMAFVTVEDRYGSVELIVFPNVLSQCSSNLYAGSVVEIIGTLNFKEDEEPRIICEKVTALPDADSLKIYVAQKRGAEVVAKNNEQNEIKSVNNLNSDAKLFLRISNLECEKYKKVKNLLELFSGDTKVVFYLTDTNKKLLAPKTLWVKLNDTLFDELCYQIGAENVVIK